MTTQDNELWKHSASYLAKMVKKKQISPVEILEHYLERIHAINPKVNALCTIVEDMARKAAERAEQAVVLCKELGPLHGLPIAIKDTTPTAGIRTTFGSKLFADHIPQTDAIHVKRIKDAGAIILGKTNVPESAHKGTTDNLLFGSTKNPWNLEKTSGGSSGGSAAAVAAGLIPFAEGSDGGGSIRVPASLCGIYGLKPTYGRIPFEGNRSNMFSSQNPFLHYGPLTRTVEDAALLFSVMNGPDPLDPYCLPDMGEQFVDEMKETDRSIRIAYSPDLGIYKIDQRVRASMETAVAQLRRIGYEVEHVSVDFELSGEEIIQSFRTIYQSQLAAKFSSYLPESESLFTASLVKMIKSGEKVTLQDMKRVEPIRTHVWHKIQDAFATYDLLVTPTVAIPAFSHRVDAPDEINGMAISPDLDWFLTPLFNLTGHPVASMPIGFTDDGLPVGMQIIGRRFAESTILRVSYDYERAFPWTDRVPRL